MAKYSFQLANGKTMTLEGDEQPSDADVEEAAAAQGVQLSLAGDPTGPLDQKTKNDRLIAANQKPLSEPDTYAGGFLRSAADTMKRTAGSTVHGALSLVNPKTYTQGHAAKLAEEQQMLNEAKGNAEPTHDYGIAKAKELGAQLSTPEGGGEMIGTLMTGLVVPRAMPRAVALGGDVVSGAKQLATSPLGRKIAAPIIKHATTAGGALVGGALGGGVGAVPGAVAGAALGEELAGMVRPSPVSVPKLLKPTKLGPTIEEQLGLTRNPSGELMHTFPDTPVPTGSRVPSAPVLPSRAAAGANLAEELGVGDARTNVNAIDEALLSQQAPVPAPAAVSPALSPARQAMAQFYADNPGARIGGEGRMTMQGTAAPGGLQDVNKIQRYPMPKVDPFEAQLLKMEQGQPGFAAEGSSSGLPHDVGHPGLTVDAAPRPPAPHVGVPEGVSAPAENAIVEQLLAQDAPAAIKPPRVPMKDVRGSKSRRSPMSDTNPKLTVAEEAALGLKPGTVITELPANVLDELYALRASKSAAYRTEAGLDAGFRRATR